MNTPAPYTFGADLCAPFGVTLTIDAPAVDPAQFRADLPRIAAKLESFLLSARAEAARGPAGIECEHPPGRVTA